MSIVCLTICRQVERTMSRKRDSFFCSNAGMTAPSKRSKTGSSSLSASDADANPFLSSRPGALRAINTAMSAKANTTKKKTGGEQLYLDFGQRDFSVTCAKCGMLYHKGVSDDEMRHKKYCRESQLEQEGIVPFVSCKTDTLFPFEGKPIKVPKSIAESDNSNETDVIVKCSFSTARTMIDRLCSILTREFNTTVSPESLPTCLLYVYVARKHVVGVLLVDIGESHSLRVLRVWTCSAVRRQGVATRLLDTARASAMYGTTILRENVMFSTPTEYGQALARHFVGLENEVKIFQST